ncbi:zinc-ribbon domain-containing protein [Escherichia coli]|uniref:zinc-ribbon domain-containing protein n=1 Tax=Escherichia coli TaxID=562 RepID=UPI00201DFDEE|nr:zinc-ribbon domain-containing protein [Escherichia coli]
MYAKSFLALDGNGRLTGARTAQAAPYAHYTCHLCGSALRYHPQYDTELPWFEHTDDRLTEHGQQCPYVRPERREIQLIKRLQQFVPDALPVVRKASWHCRQCHHDYYGEPGLFAHQPCRQRWFVALSSCPSPGLLEPYRQAH